MSDDQKPVELDAIGQPLYPPMDESGMVDISQIRCNLAMTPAERLRRHDEFVMFIKLAREANAGKNDSNAATSQATE